MNRPSRCSNLESSLHVKDTIARLRSGMSHAMSEVHEDMKLGHDLGSLIIYSEGLIINMNENGHTGMM